MMGPLRSLRLANDSALQPPCWSGDSREARSGRKRVLAVARTEFLDGFLKPSPPFEVERLAHFPKKP